MATDFGTGLASGVATNATNAIVGVLFQQLKEVRDLGKNLQLLNTELDDMDEKLRYIQEEFENQQRQLPKLLERRLTNINNALVGAKPFIQSANRQRERCLGCCLFFNFKIPAEIREWKTRFGDLSQQLQSDLSTVANTQLSVESAQPRLEILLQPEPDSGFVGSGNEAARQQLLKWLNEPDSEARVIGVFGMAGVGKTTLLQLIHNNCQKKMSSNFDSVIWCTVSQNCTIESLQRTIAESVHLKFEPSSSTETGKMKLYAFLKNKKILFILDDVWSSLDLVQVGVNLGHDNGNKVLISSRYRDVVEIMGATKYCMMIRPLSTEEGWDLFSREASTKGGVLDNNLQDIARKIASECSGLPLAIKTVAAALARKKTADEWTAALDLMQKVDPSFPSTHRTIDKELYQRLKWTYNDLPDDQLKMCFLYCAAFPEDAHIEVETLVEMWTAERLVYTTGTTYFMDVGRGHIGTLVDRCLIEYVDANKKRIKVHDVLRDMAIYIGQGEENWLFLSGQHLQHFPSENVTSDRKRISLLSNEINDLPLDLKRPTVVSLLLARNDELKEIPERFLVNFMSLKVLDLSQTSIKALPTAVGQLGQLEFLNLSRCIQLKDLPDSICNLSHLQFLILVRCDSLTSLPDRIGDLKGLKHLEFPDGEGDVVIPQQISQLTSLNKLLLPWRSTSLSVEDLTNLSNLIELEVTVKPEIKRGSMSTWSRMRKLKLRFERGNYENRDDAALDILPRNMQSMKVLQSFTLFGYSGVSLPNCICQFQDLKDLILAGCGKLKELPALEVGCEGTRGNFPMLETLYLYKMDSLESIVLNAKTMLQLQVLEISRCSVLKTFRMEGLPKLRKLRISHCAELKELFLESGSGAFPMLEKLKLWVLPSLESRLEIVNVQPQIAEVGNMHVLKTFRMEQLLDLEVIDIEWCPKLEVEIGSLPRLVKLILVDLEKVESIARPLSVWNEETMPSLKLIMIRGCSLLRRLPMEMDKLSSLKIIAGDLDWWENINWENDNVKIKLLQCFCDLDIVDAQMVYL